MADILAPEIVSELGEGPIWSDGRLYWFDILGKRLFSAPPDGAAPRIWQFDEHFSAAGRIPGGLILASETALWRFDPETGTKARLVALEAERPETRSNDGRADRQGGFWIGTMGKTAPVPENGALYRYYRGELRRLRSGIAIPNAICFAPDGRRGYFADTQQDRIFTWPLDAEGWPEAEPEVFHDFSAVDGGPDGAVVDAEGALWVALWGGSRVLRLRPDGSAEAEIALPASQITCPAFGGDLRQLYVTSAWAGLDAAARAAEPEAGRVFAAKVAIPGLPEPMVALTGRP